MISLLRMLRADLRESAQRRRFPLAVLHDDVVLNLSSKLGCNSVLFPGVRLSDTQVGDYTYIQARTQVFNAEIGPYCSIAAEVIIGLVDHPTHFVSTSPVFYDNNQPLPRFFVDEPFEIAQLARTVIGADVWIGQRAMIKAGVTIGVGAIIGAGALVTGDVSPYSIVVGAPARVLRMRFNTSVIEGLLRSEWWMLPEQVLIELAQHFDNPEDFISTAQERLTFSSL